MATLNEILQKLFVGQTDAGKLGRVVSGLNLLGPRPTSQSQGQRISGAIGQGFAATQALQIQRQKEQEAEQKKKQALIQQFATLRKSFGGDLTPEQQRSAFKSLQEGKLPNVSSLIGKPKEEKAVLKNPKVGTLRFKDGRVVEDVETFIKGNKRVMREPQSGEFIDLPAGTTFRVRQGKGVTVNVGEAEKAFEKEFGKVNAQKFFDRRDLANDAANSLRNNSQALDLLNKGAVTGFGANFLVGFGKALQQVGINFKKDETANSEAFIAAQAKQIANIIKAFGAGTGLSDADREFATKAAGGDITITETAIRRILDINDKASRNVIQIFNKEAGFIDPSLSPFPLNIETPKTKSPLEVPGQIDPEVFKKLSIEEQENLLFPEGSTKSKKKIGRFILLE